MADETSEQNGIKNYNPENASQIPGRSLPSLFANRFFVLRGADVVRLSFGTSLVGEDDIPLTMSVSMPHWTAKSLAESLLQLLEEKETPKTEQTDG